MALLCEMNKQIPTTAEIYAALREAFKKVVADEKAKGNGQDKVAGKIGVLPNYVSNVANGRKNLGDDVVARIDLEYPGWRTITNEVVLDGVTTKTVEAPSPLPFKIEILGEAEFERQLLLFFNGMSRGHKEALVAMANSLYSLDNQHDFGANPNLYKHRQTDKTDTKIKKTEKSK